MAKTISIPMDELTKMMKTLESNHQSLANQLAQLESSAEDIKSQMLMIKGSHQQLARLLASYGDDGSSDETNSSKSTKG